MRPAIIDGHTTTLNAPINWNREANGHCGALHVKAEVIDGIHFLRHAWEFEENDAALLLAGAKLLVGVTPVMGQHGKLVHPVVNLAMSDVPEEWAPTLTASIFAQGNGSPAVRVQMIFGPGKAAFAEAAVAECGLGAAVAQATDSIVELAKANGWMA